jgi:hypothetical protein
MADLFISTLIRKIELEKPKTKLSFKNVYVLTLEKVE